MTSYDSGDIVLVHYPFTDLTTSKKRPAVVLSSRTYIRRFGDVVLMPLTRQPGRDAAFPLSQWKAAGLLKPTWLKPTIGTLVTRLIEKRIGTLHNSDGDCVKSALSILIETRWIKS